MRLNTLFFLSILSCLCFALGQGSYDDCCLKYLKNMDRNVQKHAVRYKFQKTDGGCNIPAVIFTMKRGRKYCANPNEKWVQELVRKVDEKGKIKTDIKYKKQRKSPFKG